MDVLSALAGYLAQSRRTLDLTFWPEGPALVPQRARLTEALSTPYVLDVVALHAAHGGLELKSLLGMAAALGIATGQGRRHVTGIVSHVRRLGHDGGLTSYGLRIVPGLALLALDRRSRLFQGRSVPEIVTQVLNEHIQRNAAIGACFRYETRLTRHYPVHPYCNQYRESTQAFIERLLAEEGISYTFTFTLEGGVPTHTLVLFDDAWQLPAAGVPQVPYHPLSAEGHAMVDTFSEWQGERQLVSAQSTLSSYEYDEAAPRTAAAVSTLVQGELGDAAACTLEDYDPQTHCVENTKSRLALGGRARLRQLAHDLAAKTFHAAGTIPALAVGTWFELTGHPDHAGDSAEERQFVVTGQTLEAVSNLPTELDGLLGPSLLAPTDWAPVAALAAGAGDNGHAAFTRLTAVRRKVPIVPLAAAVAAKPTAHGLQTAIVVGPPGAVVYTDAEGRVFVQPHYQRPEEHPSGGADFDEKSSCAIRVAYPHAGAGFGYQAIPRVGEEVLIDYIEGDIDRPLVVGAVYNGRHPVPTFSGEGELPGNGVLTGIKSQEHRGPGYGELVLDDTPGQVRSRLASSHAASELNLGFLSTPRRAGAATPRGQGVELRTDAAAALRAAHGLLLTTWARSQAEGHQLDRQELARLMAECGELFRALGEYAAGHGGIAPDAEGQAGLTAALDGWPDAAHPVGSGAPAMVLGAEAGLASVTPASVLTAAGGNIDAIAQQHLQWTSGQRLQAQAGAGIALFAQAGGLRAVANQGEMRFEAQADDLVAAAAKAIRLTADGDVLITGQRIHLVAADGSYHTIGGGHELGSDADLRVRTAQQRFEGPATQATQPADFGREGTERRYRLHFPAAGGESPAPAVGQAYRIALNDGRIVQGIADADGLTDLLQEDVMRITRIDLLKPRL